MDKIEKALKKLAEKEKRFVKEILVNIQKENLKSLDMKKLKGRDDVFRIRKGKTRIVFRKSKESTSILSIERKTDRTYKDL